MPARSLSFRRRALWGATALSACLAVLAPPAFADAVDVPPVRSIVLSTAGIAEFTRVADPSLFASGEAVLEVPLRMKDIDDTLKSLIVLGEGVEGASMRLPSSEVLADVFAGLPFAPEDLGAMDALLARLPGARVRVEIPDGMDDDGSARNRVIEGKVMGVAQDPACASEGRCPPALLIQGEEAMERVVLWDGVRVALLDAADADAVARGLEALASGGREDGRTLHLSVRATGEAPVFVSTVLEAPIWKTAYRAAIDPTGAVAFQAWAVVENATQEDWNDITLTLVSGTARTLRADLYARRYAQRETMSGGGNAKAFENAAGVFARSAMQSDTMMEMSAPMSAPMPAYGGMGDMEGLATAEEGFSGARFVLPDAVSVKAGEVLSTPFLSGDLDARAVAYHTGYAGEMGTDFIPMPLTLVVKNTLDARLPEGVLTLYKEAEGFVADARVPAMEPKTEHLLAVAAESGARVRQNHEDVRSQVGVRSGQGVVRVDTLWTRTTTYTVSAPEAKAVRAVVDHPDVYGADVRFEGGTPEQVKVAGVSPVWRMARDMEPGEEWKFKVVLSETERSEWRVGDVPDEQLLAWAGAAMDDTTKAWLEGAVVLRRAVAEAERALGQDEANRARLVDDQERKRGMLETLAPGTAGHERFLAEALAAEDALAAIDAERVVREEAVRAARAAFDAHIGL